MITQNITLSVPKHILQQAKLIAVRRNVSLSSMMSDYLAELVAQESEYEQAMRRSLTLMEQGLELNATYTWSREELHEREA
jgi:hypothetical protein